MVPSLIATSSRGFETPSSYFLIDTVADISAVPPHAVKGKLADRAGFRLEAVGVRRDAHLDDGSFVDSHVLKGLENAILVLCSDSHGFPYRTLCPITFASTGFGFMVSPEFDRDSALLSTHTRHQAERAAVDPAAALRTM